MKIPIANQGARRRTGLYFQLKVIQVDRIARGYSKTQSAGEIAQRVTVLAAKAELGPGDPEWTERTSSCPQTQEPCSDSFWLPSGQRLTPHPDPMFTLSYHQEFTEK